MARAEPFEIVDGFRWRSLGVVRLPPTLLLRVLRCDSVDGLGTIGQSALVLQFGLAGRSCVWRLYVDCRFWERVRLAVIVEEPTGRR